MVTNPSADTLYLQSTLPFGTVFASETTGSSNRLFTSYDRSPATGLDYAVNRTYSPGQGRFTTVDPIGMASVSIENPQSLNLFSDVQNDPIDFRDPTGLVTSTDYYVCNQFTIDFWNGEQWDAIYAFGCLTVTVYSPSETDAPFQVDNVDIKNEVNKRLDIGDCRKKLNDLLTALGKGKLRDKRAGTTGFDALVSRFFGGDRIIETQSGFSNYDSKTGKISLNTNSDGRVNFVQTIVTEFIHEALHGARQSGFSHQQIFQAIAKVENLDARGFKADRVAELASRGITRKTSGKFDDNVYRDAVNSWINKVCGGGSAFWDNLQEKYKLQ